VSEFKAQPNDVDKINFCRRARRNWRTN